MQRKRSWGTVLSLKHAQFLSFSENRNNSRLLRTFSRWELKYNSLHCFLIETAQSLQKRRESWLLKVSSCFKGWPSLKRVSLPSVPIGRDPGAGFMLACGQGSAELPFKSLFPERKGISVQPQVSLTEIRTLSEAWSSFGWYYVLEKSRRL